MPTRRALLAVALSIVSSAHVAASSGKESAGAVPAIRWDSLTHDFGTIPSDKKVTYAWPFRNDGSAALEILATQPTCGCTASVPDGRPVPAGSAGTLTVTFDPAGQNGSVRKTLAVVTNDPSSKRTILTIRANVIPKDEPALAEGHPPLTGQSLLTGSCATCHSLPARGLSAQALYASVCAMCHGAKADGGRAPSLRAQDYLASHDDKTLEDAIAYGTANPKMPGFSDVMGGPLDAGQIASLVKLLRAWGPAPARRVATLPPSR